MPRPPPPAAALIITGKPMRRGAERRNSTPSIRRRPGTAHAGRAALARAAALSPMVRIVSGVGPMKTSPAASTASAKPAFSDRNP